MTVKIPDWTCPHGVFIRNCVECQVEIKNARFGGHNSLAEMVSTHIEVWRDALKELREKASLSAFSASQASYIDHELRALDDIEKACEVEKGL